MPIRWLALTGTPGVGKTSLARRLRQEGFDVVDGNQFARDHDCLVGVDPERGSQVVDPARVGRALRRREARPAQVQVLESHWAHAVPGMDAALVLRLHPAELAVRLRRRRWRAAKVRENLEAEALDVILQEAIQRMGAKRVGELDTTALSTDQVARRVLQVLREPDRRLIKLEIGRIDWSEELLKWS